MPRLRRVDCSTAGIRRVRRGRGFIYVGPSGERVTDPAVLQRISDLVIPPAWRDVWICPLANGHIQAVGTDDAGRRQYRYHDAWRVARDREKHERMLAFASQLPAAREQVSAALSADGMPRERVLAVAVRLLDLGFFRIGSEEYVEENNSFGLATIRKEHVSISDGVITFDYPSKSGKRRIQSVADEMVLDVITALKRRRGGGDELLAFRDGRHWRDIKSDDINDYLRQVTGGDYSAKDFRTWHATVLCAVALAVSVVAPVSESARKRAVTRAVKETAFYLGNTPAVCRASYIDPRVIDAYNDGATIAAELEKLGAGVGYGELSYRGAIERAVIRLLAHPESWTPRIPAVLREEQRVAS